MHFLAEPETWVAVGFLLFIGILIYVGVPKMLTDALDARGKRVQADLNEARRLKEEAQKLLAEYQGKRRQADEEAAAIIEGAKAEAERIADESKVRMEEFVGRRTKMAETKIAQAEAQAVADVRAAAAEAAVAAAEKILSDSVKGKVADDLIGRGIADVKTKLN
jgi:F-type H+-transporting ATPase subunit b